MGPVTDLVAPSVFHDLFIPQWMDAYPQARLHAASACSCPSRAPWVKGAAWRQAPQMAIDEINAQGGVLDRPLEMLVIDIARPRRS